VITIRRNNPGNIRKVTGQSWQGEIPGTVAPNFVTFDTLVYGYRAQIKLLNNYVKRGYNTLDSILNRWAPPSDNNPTEKYIEFVSQKTGIGPRAAIVADDYNTLSNVALNMSLFEHGVQADDGTLTAAIKTAIGILTGAAQSIVEVAKNNPIKTVLIIGLALYLLSD